MKVLKRLKNAFRPCLLIFRLIKIASENNQNKLYFLSFLLIINGFLELLTVASILPFLTTLTDPEAQNKSVFLKFLFDFFNISANQSLLVSSLFFLSLIALSLIIRLYTLRYGTNLNAELGTTLSTNAYKNSIYLPYESQINQNSGELINTLSTELEATVSTINITIRSATALVTFLFIFFGLIALNPFMALSCGILFGFSYAWIAKMSNTKLNYLSSIYTKSNNKIVRHIQESAGSIRDIIIDNNQNYYISNYKNIDKKKRKTEAEIEFISAYPYYGLEALGFFIFAFLGIILSLTISQPSNTLSILGTLAIGLQKLLRSTQQIYVAYTRIRARESSFIAILNVFEEKVELIKQIKEKKFLQFNSNIQLKNLFFSYKFNSSWVLKNINLTLKKGEVIGLIGATGSGKSTLIDIIMGLLAPSKGEVLIDGKNINNRYRLKEKWFNSISHVPQSIYLCDGTITENIALGLEKKDVDFGKVLQAAETAQIKNFVDSLEDGFDSFVGERGIKLSGGERQRIAVARAIYKQSRILILDEATSALDHETETKLIHAINDLDSEITIIMIAHRLTSLSFCNKVIEIKKGRVIAIKNSIN